jgi:hypothetical protein
MHKCLKPPRSSLQGQSQDSRQHLLATKSADLALLVNAVAVQLYTKTL